MAKVLLINPSYQASYGGTKASIVNPFFPTLGLATIAATAKQQGHKVEIFGNLKICEKIKNIHVYLGVTYRRRAPNSS